jgi:hypothetical protein
MKRDHNGLSIVEKGYFSRQFFILSRTKIPIFINSLLMVGGMLIGAEGASLSAGVPGSLLCALAPAGSPLPRTPAGVFAPSAPINRPIEQPIY